MSSDIIPIGPSLDRDPEDPTEIIRRAVNAAIATGLTVSTVPDLGVHCTSGHGQRWEADQRVRVLSPLGAVLLMRQPQISDADAALAATLDVNPIWIRAGVPVARVTETTEPILVETPRQLIDGLLDSLTTSQVFEAAADRLNRGAAKLSSDRADESAQAEAMLRVLADDTRGWGV